MAEGSLYVTTPPRAPTRPADADLALEAVGTDVYARSRALNGLDVRFVVGALDCGRGVQDAAFGHGGTPEGLADQWAEAWQATLEAIDVHPDVFTRTGETAHQRVVKAFFLKLFDQGDIEKAPDAGGYVLRASKYARKILAHLDDHPDLVLPQSRHEAVARAAAAADGVPDLCICRPKAPWAIAVPIDPDYAVDDWFDALISYLTSSGYLADPQLFERVWPPAVQVVTAADLRVHALAWPAVLFAAGLGLPEHLLVRGRVQLDGGGDAAALAGHLGSDGARYGLLRAASFTADATLSMAQLVERCNADLSGRLGRLVDEVLAAIEEQRQGTVPRPGSPGDAEGELIEAAGGLFATTSRLVAELDFHAALDRVFALVDRALDYAHGVGLATAEGRDLDTALYVLAETCRLAAFSLRPFLPRAAWAIEARLGLDYEALKARELAQWGLTRPQTPVRRGDPLLPPIVLPAT